MKYAVLSLLLITAVSTCFGNDILAVLPVPGEGCYFISSQNTSGYETVICAGLLSLEGELLWERESGIVRVDATGVSACLCRDGGFLTALAFGIGYTDILITKWNIEGEALSSDTISFLCYDSPQNLFQFKNGFVLMWDSWSSQRGVHLARLDQNGSVIETVFAVETLNPASTALAADDNSFVVAVSPIVACDNPALTAYTAVDTLLWSHFLPEKDHNYADFVVDLSYTPSGELVALWETMATGEQPASYCVTEHSRNGDMLDYYSFPMERFSDISFRGLQAGTGIVLMGHSPEKSAFWIAFTGLHGNLIEKMSVNLNFIPTGIQFLSDHSFLVTGVEDGSNEITLLHLSVAGEILWVFPEREL